MISLVPDWLKLTCFVVGAWFMLSVVVITPWIILGEVATRRNNRRNAETVRQAGAELVAEAERIANGLTS
jgi:hypothetical protein